MEPRWHLSYARGYLELGMIAEAAAELDALPKSQDSEIEVLSLRIALYQKRNQWPELKVASAELARQRPQDAGAWIVWAYATRRTDSLEAAEKILAEAKVLHPKDPTIAFNLGCYRCQRGDLEGAHRLVEEAIALDSQFRELAIADPDLSPLRAAGLIRRPRAARKSGG